MSHARPSAEPPQDSLVPEEGWHCSHLFYAFDRGILARLDPAQLSEGNEAIVAALDPQGAHATQRLQTSIVSGHKADFGVGALHAGHGRRDS